MWSRQRVRRAADVLSTRTSGEPGAPARLLRYQFLRLICLIGTLAPAAVVDRLLRLHTLAFGSPLAAGMGLLLLCAASDRSRREVLVSLSLIAATVAGTSLVLGVGMTSSLALASATTIGAGAALRVVAWRRRSCSVRGPGDIVLLLAASLAGATVSAPLMTLLDARGAGVSLLSAGTDWILQSATGMFVIAATALTIGRTAGAPRFRFRAGAIRGLAAALARRAETGLCLLTLGAAYLGCFGLQTGLPLAWVVLPILVWLALRVNIAIAAGGSLLTSASVMAATMTGHGPFAGHSALTQALLVDSFAVSGVMLTLVVALYCNERSALVHMLRVAEANAANQAQLLGQLIDTISDGVVAVDGAGRTMLSNPAARALLDLNDPAAAFGIDHHDLFHPDGRPFAAADLPMVRARAGDSVFDQDVVIHDAVLGTVVMNVNAHPLSDSVYAAAPVGLPSDYGGAPTGFGAVVAFRDVTVDRTAASEVAKARDLFSAVLDSTTEQAIIGTDLDGLITVFNHGAERMLGYTGGEMLGRSPTMLYLPSEVAGAAAELHIDPGFEVFAQRARQQRHDTRQWTYLTSDGRSLQVSVTTTAMRTHDGQITGYIQVATDITARIQAENDLAESERLFRRSFDTAPIAMAMLCARGDDMGRFLRVNHTFTQFTGFSETSLLTTTIGAISEDSSGTPGSDGFADLTAGTAALLRAERSFVRADGETAWGRLSASLVDPSGGDEPYVLCMIEDITARRAAEAALTHQALHDSLTGLPNRMLFGDRLELAIAASGRSGVPVGVLYLDLDGFKAINDSAGHAVGDQVLCEAAERLRACVRPGDTVARLGGDEFAVVCPEAITQANVRGVADRILEAIRQPMDLAAGRFSVGVSIGISTSGTELDAAQLLRDADEAMYEAKRGGKNRVHSVSDNALRLDRAARVLPDLQAAITRNELVMFGQPVVDLRTGRILAVETLIRWRHPRRGLLAPGEFLDVAEQSPLMLSIGRRVLEESCRLAATWRESLGELAPAVHVNVSGRQLESGNLTEDVTAALRRHGLPPSQLVLELTETHMPMIAHSLRADLDVLRGIGIRLAIDDLGTGYSSLSRLTELPVDMLKIDLSFVRRLGQDAGCDAVVRAILGLGDSLGFPVVAEGVETAEQAELLIEYGCEVGQGYLYSRPLPEDELLARLRVNSAALTGA
jgi:diguanylate cyclase (GGDEF)-like protein/PAS domain S-box-containing protein